MTRSGISMVRAGEKAHLFDACREGNFVTIGWFHTPPRDMSNWEPDDVRRWMATDYPIGKPHLHRDGTSTLWTKGKTTRDENQIKHFLFAMDEGSFATVAAPGLETLLIGMVTQRYDYRDSSTLGAVKDPYLHFKPVEWLRSLERRDMSDALVAYILGRRYTTVFGYADNEIADEIHSAL